MFNRQNKYVRNGLDTIDPALEQRNAWITPVDSSPFPLVLQYPYFTHTRPAYDFFFFLNSRAL